MSKIRSSQAHSAYLHHLEVKKKIIKEFLLDGKRLVGQADPTANLLKDSMTKSIRLYSIKYADRHTAVLVFQSLKENCPEGLLSVGLENYRIRHISKNQLKLVLALDEQKLLLTSLLNGVKEDLRPHPLFSYLSFEYYVAPISEIDWNFDDYSDPEFQKLIIEQRS